MGSIKDKITGKAKEIEGRATGDKVRTAQGKAEQASGKVKGMAERASAKVKAGVRKVKAKIRSASSRSNAKVQSRVR